MLPRWRGKCISGRHPSFLETGYPQLLGWELQDLDWSMPMGVRSNSSCCCCWAGGCCCWAGGGKGWTNTLPPLVIWTDHPRSAAPARKLMCASGAIWARTQLDSDKAARFNTPGTTAKLVVLPVVRFGSPGRWCHERYTSSVAVMVALNTRMHPHAFNGLVPWNLRTPFGLKISSLFRGIAKLARIENQLESPSHIPQISDGLQVINHKKRLVDRFYIRALFARVSFLPSMTFLLGGQPQIRRCFFVSHERNTLLLSIILVV